MNAKKLESYTFTAPACYASALINGDCTGFSDDEQAEFDAWAASHADEARDVVDCEGESYIGRWPGHGLTELATYTALSR